MLHEPFTKIFFITIYARVRKKCEEDLEAIQIFLLGPFVQHDLPLQSFVMYTMISRSTGLYISLFGLLVYFCASRSKIAQKCYCRFYSQRQSLSLSNKLITCLKVESPWLVLWTNDFSLSIDRMYNLMLNETSHSIIFNFCFLTISLWVNAQNLSTNIFQ